MRAGEGERGEERARLRPGYFRAGDWGSEGEEFRQGKWL